MAAALKAILRDPLGVTAIEYAVIGSVIITAIVVAVGQIGVQVSAMFASILPGL